MTLKYLVLFLPFYSCQDNKEHVSEVPKQAITNTSTATSSVGFETSAVVTPTLNIKSDAYSFKIVKIASGNYAYDIYINGAKYIHQETIPAIQGENEFTSEKDAENLAGLILNKLKKGIMPPAIDVREIDSLKIKY